MFLFCFMVCSFFVFEVNNHFFNVIYWVVKTIYLIQFFSDFVWIQYYFLLMQMDITLM